VRAQRRGVSETGPPLVLVEPPLQTEMLMPEWWRQPISPSAWLPGPAMPSKNTIRPFHLPRMGAGVMRLIFAVQ